LESESDPVAVRPARWRSAGRPISRDAIVRIASMTKPVMAVAAMMLVEEEGRLRLDEPIDRLANLRTGVC